MKRIGDVADLPREDIGRFFTLTEDEYRMVYDTPLGSILRGDNPPRDVALSLVGDRTRMDLALYLADHYRPRLIAVHQDLVAAAQTHGCTLHDVRVPSVGYPIANGKKRTGKRCLAVGTDCSVGKMYTAMAMERDMQARGMKATFRATGQTGILITGDGVPLDAVIADFMAGSIEWLTPDNEPDHWDLIEGQGSLFHASYSGVTLALIHGGQPDALILCHEPTRPHMRGLPDYQLPSLEQVRDMALSLAAHRAGVELVGCPDAVVHYRYRTDARSMWRQGLAYGNGRCRIVRDLIDHGDPRPSRVAGWRSWAWLVVNIPRLATRLGRVSWIWVAANRLGQLRGSIRYRVIYL